MCGQETPDAVRRTWRFERIQAASTANRASRLPYSAFRLLLDAIVDRHELDADVGDFGHSGAGKTYLLSTLAMGALDVDVQVFIIDPEHEYGRLAQELGGLDVPLALGSGHSINVLELRGEARNESTIGSAVADAVELCAVLCGELEEADRVRLELAKRETFLSTVQPVLADVVAWLRKESRIGQVLSRWVQGSLGQIFSRPTNGRLDAGMIEPRGL